MKIKVHIKVILSYILNMLSLVRMGKVGKGIDIRMGLKVNNPKNIEVGDFVSIGRMSRLSSYEGGKIIIEKGCYIGQFFSILSGGNVSIGEDTLIASYVAIIGENHSMNPEVGVKYGLQPLIKSNVKIGKNCWLGEKVVVLPGVSIGDWSIIGSCSVVNKSIPSYSIAVGNPAKVIKRYDFDSKKWVRVI